MIFEVFSVAWSSTFVETMVLLSLDSVIWLGCLFLRAGKLGFFVFAFSIVVRFIPIEAIDGGFLTIVLSLFVLTLDVPVPS